MLPLHRGRPQNGAGSPKSSRTRAHHASRGLPASADWRDRWSRSALGRATQAPAAELMPAVMVLKLLGSEGRGEGSCSAGRS